jgi:hypothetical protein
MKPQLIGYVVATHAELPEVAIREIAAIDGCR